MNLKAGKILLSSASITDANFKDTVLFITEHNNNGAMAFIINKVFDRPLNALQEFKCSPAFTLYDGGPVDKEHLFFIHRCNNLITGGEKIIDDIYLGGDFKKAIILINNKTITETAIKIFVGYCGWDADELEAEIKEGSWVIMQSELEIFG
jgi:putative transcriptional regulator